MPKTSLCLVDPMLSKVLLALSTLFAVTSAQVTDCSSGKSVFTINSQDFQPNPPIVGENATLWIDYTVPDGVEVNSGTAKYSFSLNGIPFQPTTEDLCTQIPCPQVPGTFNLTSADIWNGGVSGKIVSKIEWFDDSKNLLLCSQTVMRISMPTKQEPFRKFLRSRLRGHHRHLENELLDLDSSSSSSDSSSSSSSGSSSSSSSGSSSSSSSSGNSTSSSSSSSSPSSTSSSGNSSSTSTSSSTSSGSSSSSSSLALIPLPQLAH